MDNYSFNKGFNQVQKGDIDSVKARIMESAKVRTRASFYNLLNGKFALRAKVKDDITEIFNGLGITDIWDNQ